MWFILPSHLGYFPGHNHFKALRGTSAALRELSIYGTMSRLQSLKIYVGNLPWRTTAEDLQRLFASYGAVRDATVLLDRETGRSRGFGFVTMDDQEAQEAIAALDGTELDGRQIRVNPAMDREDRGGGSYGGGDRGYGRRGGGYNRGGGGYGGGGYNDDGYGGGGYGRYGR